MFHVLGTGDNSGLKGVRLFLKLIDSAIKGVSASPQAKRQEAWCAPCRNSVEWARHGDHAAHEVLHRAKAFGEVNG